MKDHHFGRYEERRWRPIVWTSELEVGVETIDKAHRELIELYNAVREASQLKDRAWTGVLLERLGNATAAGICHSFSADGRCITLLKVLFTNVCVFDCAYCASD